MSIGQLSRRSGVSQRSLRYYEQQGLLAPSRRPNGYRWYGDADVSIAQAIRTMYEVGFSRDDVRAALPCVTGQQSATGAVAVYASVMTMRDELDERIQLLTITRQKLSEFLDGGETATCQPNPV